MKKILDTSFICSFFDLLDSNHLEAKDVFFNLSGDVDLKVPFIVAAELCINNDSFKYLPAVKAIAVKYLTNNETDLDFIARLPASVRSKLKANDCLILALCYRHNAELISFDKKLVKVSQILNA